MIEFMRGILFYASYVGWFLSLCISVIAFMKKKYIKLPQTFDLFRWCVHQNWDDEIKSKKKNLQSHCINSPDYSLFQAKLDFFFHEINGGGRFAEIIKSCDGSIENPGKGHQANKNVQLCFTWNDKKKIVTYAVGFR